MCYMSRWESMEGLRGSMRAMGEAGPGPPTVGTHVHGVLGWRALVAHPHPAHTHASPRLAWSVSAADIHTYYIQYY